MDTDINQMIFAVMRNYGKVIIGAVCMTVKCPTAESGTACLSRQICERKQPKNKNGFHVINFCNVMGASTQKNTFQRVESVAMRWSIKGALSDMGLVQVLDYFWTNLDKVPTF